MPHNPLDYESPRTAKQRRSRRRRYGMDDGESPVVAGCLVTLAFCVFSLLCGMTISLSTAVFFFPYSAILLLVYPPAFIVLLGLAIPLALAPPFIYGTFADLAFREGRRSGVRFVVGSAALHAIAIAVAFGIIWARR